MTKVSPLSVLSVFTESTPLKNTKKLVGTNIYERIEVIDHDAFDRDSMITLGTTRRGTPIEVNHLLAEADRIILTGGIRFHYFAGFGGGRKSITSS